MLTSSLNVVENWECPVIKLRIGYSASFNRRKAERELLADKLETPYSELKDELTQTLKAIEVVERKNIS
jgi:hypothetical protein